jgi:Ca-activated chloride channel family protein
MSISVVGFQVNDRVRKQLRCIAEAGGGSYVDVSDADRLGDELAALLTRAFRSYEPSGTKVAGGATRERATGLGEGLFLDSLPQTDAERWFAVDVPEGRRLIVSATAIPPLGSTGSGGFAVSLYPPSGDPVDESSLLRAADQDDVAGTTLTHSVRSARDDPPGRYFFTVNIEHTPVSQGLDVEVPVEIGVQLLKEGASVEMVRAPGELATPTPSPKPAATPAEDSSGGGSWLVVLVCLAAGLVAGFLVVGLFTRKAAA